MKAKRAGRAQGKTFIVTGGASGLGKATALLSASEGANVVVSDINLDAAKAVVDEIRKAGGKAAAVKTNVAKMKDCDACAAFALKKFGRIDGLIHFAGIVINGTALTTDMEGWDKTIAVNLTGSWLMSRAVMPSMIDNGGGSIVLTASVGGLVGVPMILSYAAAKAGVIGITRQMATEYAAKNVRVNAICPGTVPTPLVINHYLAKGEATQATIEASLASAARNRYPMQRLGKPDEVAQLAFFLTSDESAFITGTAIPIDGGLTAAGWTPGT